MQITMSEGDTLTIQTDGGAFTLEIGGHEGQTFVKLEGEGNVHLTGEVPGLYYLEEFQA